MSKNPSPEISSYAGRWVALVRGKIIAQGDTREQAFQSARSVRSKEEAEIRFMAKMPISSPLLDRIRALLLSGEPVYLVGGAVRDAVRGQPTHDLDFTCRQGLQTARKIADGLKAAFFPLDEAFDTGRVILQNQDGSRDILDFAGFRGDSLNADLFGRDFSINAIAMDLHTGDIIDPVGGLKNIREKRIRACSDRTFQADPIRILRAIRQAAAFQFSIDVETRKSMKAAAADLPAISAERIRDELFKILAGPQPDTAMHALQLLGVFPHVLPELAVLKGVEQSAPHVHDVWTHTLSVLRHLEEILGVLSPRYDEQKANSDLMSGLLVLHLGRYRQQINEHLDVALNADRSSRALLFFAALYHDVNKPQTKTIENNGRIRFLGHDEMGSQTAIRRGQVLHFSNDELQRLQLIITHHMRIHGQISRKESGAEISRKTIYRYFRDADEAGIDLILLALADTRATYEHALTQDHWVSALEVCRQLLEARFEKLEEIVRPPSLINGDDLIKIYRFKQGPEIGKVLEAVREAQASGLLTTRAEALAFVLGWQAHLRDIVRPSASLTSLSKD